MARRRSWLWIPLLLLFLVAVFWGATWFLNRLLLGATPSVRSGTVLEVDLSGEIVERPAVLFRNQAMGPLGLREIDTALRRAADDDDIRGVLLRVGPLAAGFGKAQEVRAAIHAFRESGKPVVAVVEIGTLVDLYVAAAADTVVQIPTGDFILGLVIRTQYYRDLLDRLGVQVEVFHTGPYKTAMNPYTETGMSEDERAAIESLLDSIYRQVLDDIAADRGIAAEVLEETVDQGLLEAPQLRDAGLVDELAYADRALELAGSLGEGRRIDLRDYNRARARSSWSLGRNTVALVHLDGMIVPGDVGGGPFGDSGVAGGETIARQLRKARLDDAVGAIVLRIDSPGGAVTASDVILREVELAAAAKPLLVSMSDVAASGGYWVTTAASRLFADPATFTGSIGVVSSRFSLAGTYDKLGIGNAVVKRGRNADMFVDSQPLSDEQRDILGRSVERHYREFLSRVAAARDMTESEVEQLASGRVWTGQQALERNLVDQIGGLHDAIEAARRAAGISAGSLTVREYPEPVSLFEGLLGLFAGSSRPVIASLTRSPGEPPVPEELRRRADLLRLLSRGGHAWALSTAPVPAPAR